jgi:hypothetical protein
MPKSKVSRKKFLLDKGIDQYCQEVEEVLTNINSRIHEQESKKKKRKKKKQTPTLVGFE